MLTEDEIPQAEKARRNTLKVYRKLNNAINESKKSPLARKEFKTQLKRKSSEFKSLGAEKTKVSTIVLFSNRS